jgi:hypothetical protein
MSDEVTVESISWNRFLTPYLAIVPELLGQRHTFTYEGHQVSVELPSTLPFRDTPRREARVTVLAYRRDPNGDIPTRLWVHSIDVSVSLDRQIIIPNQILRQPPNAYDILSKKQQQDLDSVTETLGSIAEKAFDLWLRTIRWKAANPLLGRPQLNGPESGWGTYLMEATTRTRFWVATDVINVPHGRAISEQEWDDAQDVLKNGSQPPVYYDLWSDAYEHWRLDDLQRSTVEAAVACETYLRSQIARHLPTSVSASIRRYVEEASIRRIPRFFPEAVRDEDRQVLDSVTPTLHQLLDARNTILHSGRKANLTEQHCEQYLDATKKLFAIETK